MFQPLGLDELVQAWLDINHRYHTSVVCTETASMFGAKSKVWHCLIQPDAPCASSLWAHQLTQVRQDKLQ